MAEPAVPSPSGAGADAASLLAAEPGFSPMRAARAGRRAGRHVAIMEPGPGQDPGVGSVAQPAQLGSFGATGQPAGEDPQQPAQQQQQQQLQPQQQQRSLSTSSSLNSSRGNTVTLPPSQPSSSGAAAGGPGPPPKRVGFALGTAEGSGAEGGAGQARFAGVSRRKQEQLARQEVSEARQRSKYDDKAVEGVADIPELAEEGREDISRMVAHAPKAGYAPRVQAMAELEADQGWLPARAAGDADIDLSLLTGCLLPSDQVMEGSEVWDPDLLFSQLKAELAKGSSTAEGSSAAEREELRQI